MTDYTPGPWVAEGPLVIAPSDCEFHEIADCSCNHTCRPEDECSANAELIASAPRTKQERDELLSLSKSLMKLERPAYYSLNTSTRRKILFDRGRELIERIDRG